MTKRILIAAASLGGGHLRAAEAVAEAIRATRPECEITSIDTLDFAFAPFREFYRRSYVQLVKRAPWFYGLIYEAADRPGRHQPRFGDRVRVWWDRVNMRRFTRLVTRGAWDLIIHTHFLPAEVCAAHRRAGRLAAPHVIVTTDFDTHRLWVCEPAERYFTATEEGADYLCHYGVPREKVSVTGIPIHPIFATPRGRAEARAGLGLPADRPVVLQLAGGFGMGPVERIFSAVLAIASPLCAVVVAGRNERVQRRLEQIPIPERHQARILGFTKQIDEYMAAADLVISKPGGLTTAEALARGAVMAIVNPIPGQESRNSDLLLERGAAIKINEISGLPRKVGQLLEEPGRLGALGQAAQRLARPNAAFEVARLALEEIRGP